LQNQRRVHILDVILHRLIRNGNAGADLITGAHRRNRCRDCRHETSLWITETTSEGESRPGNLPDKQGNIRPKVIKVFAYFG
jgi:hypothetical protein